MIILPTDFTLTQNEKQTGISITFILCTKDSVRSSEMISKKFRFTYRERKRKEVTNYLCIIKQFLR